MDPREAKPWLRASALVPALCAVVLVFLQGQWASRNEAQTWDEGFALATGFSQVESKRLDLLAEWPPLLGLLTYLPLKALDPKLPPPPPMGVKGGEVGGFAAAFLYGGGNPHRAMLGRARTVVLIFSTLAVAALVLWAHRLHGTAGAWLAAILCAFEPNWLAHGHLTAWDGIAASTITLALAATAWMLDRPSFGRAAVMGLLCGVALIAKFSALLLLPLLGVLFVLASPWAGRLRLRTAVEQVPFGRLSLMGLLVAVIALVVVGASYNFSFDLRHYSAGLSNIYGLTRAGFENYLLGEFREQPFRHYYLVALLAKTPLGFLALFPVGLWVCVRDPQRHLWLPAALAVALFMAATAFDRLNLGIRHVVPAIPAMILLAAGAVRLRPARLGAKPVAWAAFVLASLGAAETLWRAPYYLSFFNLAAGGPRRGIEVLDASNIDWGQDLVALERIQREEGLGELALQYHGSADPSAYGIRFRPMRPRELHVPRAGQVYAISVHLLNRMGRPRAGPTDWLRRFEPWRRAGNSIYLYRF
jgi:4-amino-4-deoxy-L-arabinose transferase-like glycosyltransferase